MGFQALGGRWGILLLLALIFMANGPTAAQEALKDKDAPQGGQGGQSEYTEGSIALEVDEVTSLEELLELVRSRNPQIQSADAKIATAQTEVMAANPAFQNRFRQVPANIRYSEKEFALKQAIAERAQTASTVQVLAAGLWCALGAAARGEEVARDQEKMLQPLLERAESMKRINEGAAVLVEAVSGELQGRRYAQMKLKRQQETTKAQLQYLLGDMQGTMKFSAKETMVPLKLRVAQSKPADLIEELWKNGPGIHELEGIIDAALVSRDNAATVGRDGLGPMLLHFVPCTGNIKNRNEAFRAANHDVADNVAFQANVAIDDARARMGAVVREAFGIIRQGEAELQSATEQIKRASEAYRINDLRLKMNVQGATAADVLTSLSGMDKAHSNFLNSLNDYNFAQARLAALLRDLRSVSPDR